jgi:TonB family protein
MFKTFLQEVFMGNALNRMVLLNSMWGALSVGYSSAVFAKSDELPRRANLTGGSIEDKDYPAQLYARGIGGRVVMRWAINPSGRVQRCQVVASSGSSALDNYSCNLVIARFMFDAARDEVGKKIWSVREQHVDWRPNSTSLVTPEYYDYTINVKSFPGNKLSVLVLLNVLTDETGKPKSCSVFEPSKIAALNKIACSALVEGGPLVPLLDDAGIPQLAMHTVIVRFARETAAVK